MKRSGRVSEIRRGPCVVMWPPPAGTVIPMGLPCLGVFLKLDKSLAGRAHAEGSVAGTVVKGVILHAVMTTLVALRFPTDVVVNLGSLPIRRPAFHPAVLRQRDLHHRPGRWRWRDLCLWRRYFGVFPWCYDCAGHDPPPLLSMSWVGVMA